MTEKWPGHLILLQWIFDYNVNKMTRYRVQEKEKERDAGRRKRFSLDLSLPLSFSAFPTLTLTNEKLIEPFDSYCLTKY